MNPARMPLVLKEKSLFMNTPETSPESLNFEAELTALEDIVKKMESDLPLSDALECFERGIALSRKCQESLKNAEQKVRILIEKNGSLQTEPFLPEE